jgi:peptidoglycan/LPS O-acetylase OafA/YrhL
MGCLLPRSFCRNVVGCSLLGAAAGLRSRPAHLLAGCNALAAAFLFRFRLLYQGARGRAIAAVPNAPLPLPGPAVQRLIRTLAGTAFGLYLLHYPLLHFFSTVIPGAPQGAAHRVAVFGLALGGSLVLAYPIERRKAVVKRGLRSSGASEAPLCGNRA